MKGRNLCLLFLVLVLSSCGGSKLLVGSTTANSALSAKDIIKTHQAASPNFSTMAVRVQVRYEDEKKKQSITVSLRMEKDKKIWVKASLLGITLAKVLITPERVSYYETIGNTYFDGDFALLSEWLGTTIDFKKAQAILLGQSIFSLSPSQYATAVVQNRYKLQPKKQPSNFIHSLLLNPDNFKIASETLSQPNNDRVLSVWYGNYQNVSGSFFPSELTINTSEKDSKTKIEMAYKKIDLNVSVRFTFTIPEGYEEIQLTK